MDNKISAWSNWIWNQSGTGFLCMDLSGRILAINQAGADLFSSSETQIKGALLTQFLDTYSHEKALRMLVQTREEGQTQDWELDVSQQETLPKLVGFTTTLIHDSANQPIGFSAILKDLTQQTQLTAQLAQVNQELEGALLKLEKTHQDLKTAQLQLIQSEKMRSLGQLVAGVAHEINNPIGFVKNNLVYPHDKINRIPPGQNAHHDHPGSANDAPPEPGGSFLTAIYSTDWNDLMDAISESLEGVNRVNQIVLALRNFSRLDEAQVKQADLIEGLQSTIQMVISSYKERIQFIEDYHPIPKLTCNPSMLNQVFMNLLVNAAQAIPHTGQIIIRTRLQDQIILLEFEDNGVGINAEELEHLGEPFYTTKPVGSGTGLGLAISYGIIEQHNGKLTFQSEPGKGTIARIELPISP